LPGLGSAAAAAGSGAVGLQPYGSGPLLPGISGLSPGGGPGFSGLQGSGMPGMQGYSGSAVLGGSQDLLQPGLGDSLDDGMMEA
jgi:hypothetical protein